MDDIDRATETEALIFDRQLQAIRANQRIRERQPVGKCYYCEEPFEQGDNRVFCDSDCQKDNEKYNQ